MENLEILVNKTQTILFYEFNFKSENFLYPTLCEKKVLSKDFLFFFY